MKKYIVYVLIILSIVGCLIYFFGEVGLLGGLLGLLGVSGLSNKERFTVKEAELKTKAEQIQKEIDSLNKERENLKAKDLTPEEEKDYWKNQ
jgi:hypothetical protein